MYANILAMGSTTTGTTAAAASGTSSSGSLIFTLVTFAVIILIFYFLIIRPQKKKDKEAKNMLAAMKKGDKIVTIGGIRGTIAVVKDSTVIVKVDDNTRIEFSKNAISSILDKKPEKKADVVEKVEAPAKEEPVVLKKEEPAAKESK
jgi:preprotein translocase subunit YajC